MSDPVQPEPVDRIEAYLDGLLSATEREAFEREAALNPTLQAELDRQRQIDASLRRLFAPPAVRLPEAANVSAHGTNGVGTLKLKGAEQQPRKRKQLRVWPIAAAIVIGLIISWWLSGLNLGSDSNGYNDPGPIKDGPAQRSLVAVYDEQVKGGFRPDWECRNRDQFASTLERRFRVPIVAEAPAGATVWGLSYRTALSRSSVLLLAKIDDEPIVVFADRVSEGTKPSDPPAASGLHLYSRQIRNVTLYELSHSPKARVLPLFRDLTPAEGPASCPDHRR